MKTKVSYFDFSEVESYPIFFEECNSPSQNKLYRNIINKHHSYKKYTPSPTRNLSWLIYETKSGNVIGAIGLSSCVLAIAPRDEYIGWPKEKRMKNSNMVANNSRFCLIKDNITIENVGSMSLKLLRKNGARRWEQRYGDKLVLLETFVEESEQRRGCVYYADNWIKMKDKTKGNQISKAPLKLWKQEDGARGKLARRDPKAAILKYGYRNSNGFDIDKSTPKLVFIKPLIKQWRKYLFM